MKQEEMFGAAQWVAAGDYQLETAQKPDPSGTPNFPILRSHFEAHGTIQARLRVVGLGFFECFVNGRRVSNDYFLPLSSDYEPRRNYPDGETVAGHRLYVPEYDVAPLLRDGDNVVALHFGGGWYTFDNARFGAPKAIFRLELKDNGGRREITSSTADKVGDSFVKIYHFTTSEVQDYRGFDDACLQAEFDDSNWPCAKPAKSLDTDYLPMECPPDRVAEEIAPVEIGRDATSATYDAGRNLTGYPLLATSAPAGTEIRVLFSEELAPDGTLDERHGWWQSFTCTCDGKQRVVFPHFTWFGFRYFKVAGDATPLSVRFIHADVAVSSAFHSGNATLDWIYGTYVHTQLCNMHAGIPSDCPHIERRGYTGDGELCAHAAMDMLDARAFYLKWIGDIADCQDIASGHVQYTAPYICSGGGPGAWGCAIVEVPYEYYLQYGDLSPAAKLYPQMLRYFDFLEAHSENGLVTSDIAGAWCLGDWCTPASVALPAPFVNNYYYVKSLLRVIEIARLTGREADLPMLRQRVQARKSAIMAAYFNTWDGNFIGNIQGANAFAVDLGLGDKRTYENLVARYRQLKAFDTGICGTDVLTRVLFEHGDGDVALALLLSDAQTSYGGMRRLGATTLWEYWPGSLHDRSHSHPMFGAAAATLFDFLLGIRQEPGKAGYGDIIVAPHLSAELPAFSGKRKIPAGDIAAAYALNGDKADISVTIPKGVRARFVLAGAERQLTEGENRFSLDLQTKE